MIILRPILDLKTGKIRRLKSERLIRIAEYFNYVSNSKLLEWASGRLRSGPQDLKTYKKL